MILDDLLLIDSARFLILINISLENNNNAFRKHLPVSRSKMTRVLLIGRVEVIYDVLSELKIYPTLHVSYKCLFAERTRKDARRFPLYSGAFA